ncbi:sulfate ABC transporter permease subunit CysW [Telmatospirillum sp. J64-1]|uniref:sulfate ABC transporter permease subunit CysW n=1 Tax=Telmatospirillum sp. J64-1 TaxID=2502183 RepID=UPI00115D1BB6|nr:sulfate ABC transporter permease subunit CysW [Telmatospirillum sp. J64-1]
MATAATLPTTSAVPRQISRKARRAAWTRRILIGLAFLLTALFLLVPVAVIFQQAFARGVPTFWANITHPETLHAIWLTVLVALIVVPINAFFGLCAAWAIAKFQFRGKKLLIALIELPFSISPIVAGVAYLMVYGSRGIFGPWLEEHGLQVMFALPGIVLVTLFVTCPFIARQVLVLMQSQGVDEEEASLSLGAGGFKTFLYVTLPNLKWALIYGVILCNARAMGEYGAVSVVSGQIRGQTNTLPLQVDLLYHDYNAAGAFAAASVLAVLALITLAVKTIVEIRSRTE